MMNKIAGKADGIEPDGAILKMLVAYTKKVGSTKKRDEKSYWSSLLLRDFYDSGAQWRKAVVAIESTMPEPLQIALSLQSSDSIVRSRAEQRLQSAIDNWTDEEIKMLSEWSAETLLPLVLTKRRTALLDNLVMNMPPRRGGRPDVAAEILKERSAAWWLDWILELTSGNEESTILAMNFARYFREDADFAHAVATELNRMNSKTFKPLLYLIVPNLALSTDQLNHDVLAELTGKLLAFRSMIGEPLIGLVASEDFAQSVLTPMWRQAAPDSEQRTFLKLALNAAGRRHNRRYL